jgi:hypothetical protein
MDEQSKTAGEPAAATSSDVPTVPASWPGAFGLFKHSKKAVKQNLSTLVVIWIISLAVSIVLDLILKKNLGGLVSYVADSLFAAAFALTYLAGIRGQAVSTGEALNKAMPFWLKMIGLNILVVLSIIGSILLLIIPFFFVLPRLVLANYFLVDQGMGVMDAYKASWAATKGHAGNVWGIIGVTILMALTAVTIIGIPFAIYWLIMYSASFAILYEFLHKSQPASPAPAAPAAPSAPTTV